MQVYKHFKEADHAAALASGIVWLSTIGECRRAEGALRRDSIEATLAYDSGHVTGNSRDPVVARFLDMSGSELSSPDSSLTLINCIAVSSLDDAYVICTTAKPFVDNDLLEEFGRHYVEIRDVDLFHFRVTKALRAMEGLLHRDQCGWVSYAPTIFEGISPPPGDLGFVKEPDKYSTQKEWRFLWEKAGSLPYRSHGIGVSGIAELCTLHLDRS